MNRYLKNTFCLLVILIPFVCSCNKQTKDNSNSQIEKDSLSIKETELSKSHRGCKIFGVSTSDNDADILIKLEEQGKLKIDSIDLDQEGKLKFAIVEFASVKFGVNPGLLFMTSRFDKEAIDSIVSKISIYYGEPEVSCDSDDDEPQDKYYKWNVFDNDKPYIFIRPIHSDKGGLTMMWEL